MRGRVLGENHHPDSNHHRLYVIVTATGSIGLIHRLCRGLVVGSSPNRKDWDLYGVEPGNTLVFGSESRLFTEAARSTISGNCNPGVLLPSGCEFREFR